MNAFHDFPEPQSTQPETWQRAVDAHCTRLTECESEVAARELEVVLATVRRAIASQRIRFHGESLAVIVDFMNSILGSARKVDPTVTAWMFNDMAPAHSALFVQAQADDRFGFQPMFTL